MERTYIGEIRQNLDRDVLLRGFVENFRDGKSMAFIVLKDITGKVQITIEQEVGASSYWSEMASMQTLDNMLMNGLITKKQYVERLPNGYMFDKQGLLDDFKAEMRAIPAGNPAGTGISKERTSESMPVHGGSGNGAVQRALNREGA